MQCHSRLCSLNIDMGFMRAPVASSCLLLVAAVAMFVCVALHSQRRNSDGTLFPAKQLQDLMFVHASDSAEFVKQCGRDWMELFANWERVQRRTLDGFSDTKAVVWKCDGSCGGLGDRQRGILTSFMLALVTDRAFFIQNEAPVPLRHYFHVANPSLHWTFEESQLEGKTVLHENFMNDVPSIGDYASGNLSHYEAFEFVIQANNFWQPFNILRNPGLSGWARKLRKYDDHVLAGCLLNYLLVPARDMQATLQEVRQSVAGHKNRLLAVQIRTGDSQNKNLTVLTEFIQLFQTCVQKLKRSSEAPLEVFLTTDSDEALVAFKSAYPHLLTFPGDIYHVDGPFGKPVNAKAAFRKLALDQLMISQADELLISRSGFSEYAAVRGFKPYYTPTNCNAGKPIPHFVLPTSQPAGISGEDIHSLNLMLSASVNSNA